jgi:hypothetical protein
MTHGSELCIFDDFGSFVEELELNKIDLNFFIESESVTIFEKILKTPNSSNFIRKCIEVDADFNVVS